MKTTSMIARGVTPMLAALLLSACAAPEFTQPAVATPASFRESQAPRAEDVQAAADGTRWKPVRPAEQQERGQWWKAFVDAELDALIAQAAAGNQNLSVAAARVKQARALAGVAEAARSPQLGVNAGAERRRLSPLEARLPAGSPLAPGNGYQARLSASYEADLFGRVSSDVAATRSDAGATVAAYRSVLLALQADVAQTWFRLRSLDAELATVERTVSLREETARVTGHRFELGDVSELDLMRARTALATARAEAIGVQRQRANAEHVLAVLLGHPAAVFSVPASPLSEDDRLPVIPAGLPSSLLERRPDIAAAQRRMEAANARIGVARAAMFPVLNLSAAAGTVVGADGDLFKWSTRSWLLGAALAAPLIDGGRNRANVQRSEAALEESVAAYRQNVLTAFAEVEDNLAGLRILAGQSAQNEEAMVSARRSADLARKSYDAGRSGYLELLDAQRTLAVVERNAVQLRGERAITTVALIRALGGGWDAPQKDDKAQASN